MRLGRAAQSIRFDANRAASSPHASLSSSRGTIKMTRFALLASLMLWSATAYAQTPSPPASAQQLDNRGTAEDQKACDRDAQRHCREVLSNGDFAVLGCLRENRTRLTRACQGVLTKYGQ
jgi:hypothetical protein